MRRRLRSILFASRDPLPTASISSTPTPGHPDTPTLDLFHTPTPKRRAFTLIELILVLVVLAILVGIMLPVFEGSAVLREPKDVSSQMLALTRHARSQAITEGVPYRLVLDLRNNAFYLDKWDGVAFVPLAEEVGQPHLIPTGVQVAYDEAATLDQLKQMEEGGQVVPERPSADLPTISFYPTGRVDPAVIRITGRDGKVINVVCLSPIEQFQIVME